MIFSAHRTPADDLLAYHTRVRAAFLRVKVWISCSERRKLPASRFDLAIHSERAHGDGFFSERSRLMVQVAITSRIRGLHSTSSSTIRSNLEISYFVLLMAGESSV